ncbi:MAG: OmpA family protein [Flavipsychrobacter sp.]|nr:OmpA family protein [Flavipsychrobacter sp.]
MRLFIIMLLLLNTYVYAQKDTFRIYFPLSDARLTNMAKHTLDSLLYYDIINNHKKIGIIGYTDNTGSDTINNLLSLNRAKTVADYFKSMGVPEALLEMVAGKGAIKRSIEQQNNQTDRRVDIIPGGLIKTDSKINHAKAKVIENDIESLAKMEAGGVLRLNNILFVPGSTSFIDVSYPILKALANSLKANPNIKIRIEGHICCYSPNRSKLRTNNTNIVVLSGSKEDVYGIRLSWGRAKAVESYLIRQGVAANRLKCAGFSDQKPLYEADGKTILPDKNRRVEIRITDK